jgi:hypothetical protein
MAPVPGVRSRVWKSPAVFENIHMLDGKLSANITDRFYIYACADIR